MLTTGVTAPATRMGVESVLVCMLQVREEKVLPPTMAQGSPPTETEMALMLKLIEVGSLSARERTAPERLREVISV